MVHSSYSGHGSQFDFIINAGQILRAGQRCRKRRVATVRHPYEGKEATPIKGKEAIPMKGKDATSMKAKKRVG
jgi:hypothetical protein